MANERQREVKTQKHWLRRLLEEAGRGVIGNTAYDFLKWVVAQALWLIVGSQLIAWGRRILGTAIPALQEALSIEVAELTLTVGTIVTIILLVTGITIIWWLFARKYRLEASEYEQAREVGLAERDQRIAELERHKESLLETQRSNLHRLNELTQESNELRDRLREQKVFKAIYYDPNYKTGWIENPEAVANFFAERGFEVLNALQLGHWVDERMKYNESCRSLLVFAQDAVPDTVADLRSDTCKLRLFLNNGARVVWHGDVPFWYQAWPGSRYEEWGAEGPFLVLRVEIIFTEFLTDQPLKGTLTEKGRMWGIVLPGPAQRGVPIQEVDDVFTLGPSIDETNTACAWRKIYNPHFPHSGFLRYWPGSRDGRDASINADYFRFATSGWSAAPDVELPEIEVPKPSPHVFLSGSQYDEFRETTSDPWQPAVVYAKPWRVNWREQAKDLIACGAKWIWIRDRVTDDEAKKGCRVFHKRDFEVHEGFSPESSRAEIVLCIDDEAIISVNQKQLGTYIHRDQKIDLTPHLKRGTNTLAMELSNHAHPQDTPEQNPTGVIYKLTISY